MMEGEALDIKTLPHPTDQNIVATKPNLTALHIIITIYS